MAEVINLNNFRKAKQKSDKDALAAQNRVRHGRRKVDRQREEREEDRSRRNLDGRHLGDDGAGGDEPA